MNNIDQWQLERQRAFDAYMVAVLMCPAKLNANDKPVNIEVFVDGLMKARDERFPKPQEKDPVIGFDFDSKDGDCSVILLRGKKLEDGSLLISEVETIKPQEKSE